MTIAVRYFSKSGNTKKIADAIGESVGESAKTVETKLEVPVDLLFLGGAIYAGNVDARLLAFVDTLSGDDVKKAVIFSTASGDTTAHVKIKGLLEARGIQVAAETFHCRSRFLFFNRKRPNAQDLADAAAFAGKQTGS